jgi:hypothetical protein
MKIEQKGLQKNYIKIKGLRPGLFFKNSISEEISKVDRLRFSIRSK